MRVRILAALFCCFAFFSDLALGQEKSHYEPSAKDLYQGYSAGWPEALLPLKTDLAIDQSYVFWIVHPPETPLDLRSADQFRKFLVRNSFFQGGIGHNLVAWSCRGKTPLEGISGMSGESYQQGRRMIEEGFGLSTFLATYTDGFLETKETAQKNLLEKAQQFGLAAIGFRVSHKNCEEMVNFLEDFTFHPSKPFLKFGFSPDPEKMEGGGCLSFASALVKKAGLLSQLLPILNRSLSADARLFAKPTALPEFTLLEGVDLQEALNFAKLKEIPWVPGEKKIKVMDPELLLYSFKIFGKAYLSQLTELQREEERNALQSSPFGDRWVLSAKRTLPEGEWDHRNYRIDSSFDRQTAQVGRIASEEVLQWLREGKKIRRLQILGFPLLLID